MKSCENDVHFVKVNFKRVTSSSDNATRQLSVPFVRMIQSSHLKNDWRLLLHMPRARPIMHHDSVRETSLVFVCLHRMIN